ncbi:MAG: restriction endonuclease subunit S, partial [bacterium]
MSKIQCIHYGDIHTTLENKILDFHNEGSLISFLKDGLIAEELLHTVDFPYLKDGDLIIVDVSEDYIGVCKCVEMKNIDEKHIISGLHTIAVRDLKNTTTKGFRTYILMHPQVVRQLRRIATGTSVYSVSKTNLSKVKLPIPPIVEQEKIAKILFCWDKVISTTQTQLIQVQLRNKWLMNQLLSGKRRIKRYVNSEQIHQTILGELPVDWKLNSLKNILSQVKKSFTPLKAELYQQIGIRSHTKGIFYKDKVTGAAL